MSHPIILDGKSLALSRETALKEKVAHLSHTPTLLIIQVGSRKESNTYIAHKKRVGERIGVSVEHLVLNETISQKEFLEVITKNNHDKSIHGMIVQLPLPSHLETHTILNAISPHKDVDGMTSENIRLLYEGKDTFIPATSRGILSLIQHYAISLDGKHVVVLGRSSLVGKPTALLLLNHNATVTIAHRKTKHLKDITTTADILIIAIGSPQFLTKDYLKEDVVVIDVGINVDDTMGIVGDVDFTSVKEKVSAITPVPGGVGPMTIISLFENLYKACTIR